MGPRGFSVRYGNQEMKQKSVSAIKSMHSRGYFFPGESKKSEAELARGLEDPFRRDWYSAPRAYGIFPSISSYLLGLKF